MTHEIESLEQILNSNSLHQLATEIGWRTVKIVIVKSIADLERLFGEVVSANQVADWNALRTAVHSISGVSAVIGGEKLRRISLKVEQNCVDDDFALASVSVVNVMLATILLIEKLEKFQVNETTAIEQDADSCVSI